MPEPRKEEVDPLFAVYGRACSQGQLLEEALRLLLLIGREYAKTQIPDEAIRYPVDDQGIKTLGELFHEVLKVEVLGGQEQRFIVSIRQACMKAAGHRW